MLKALVGSLAAFVAALFLSAASVSAQGWPAKPCAILMGFPAGSGVDVVARMLQPSLEKSLGSGAGGNLASEAVARANPDGYTFLLGTAATHGVNAALEQFRATVNRDRTKWAETAKTVGAKID